MPKELPKQILRKFQFTLETYTSGITVNSAHATTVLMQLFTYANLNYHNIYASNFLKIFTGMDNIFVKRAWGLKKLKPKLSLW